MNIIKLIFILIALDIIYISPAFAKTTDKKILVIGTKPLAELLTTSKYSAPANIISLNHSVISAEIMGRVLKIHIESGSYVKKGQKLIELDCRAYVLTKKQAKAGLRIAITQLNHAKKQFARNQRLLKQKIIPRELYDKAEAGQLSALADIALKKIVIESTELTIRHCYISAPFSGQITKRMVQNGQLVSPGTPLLKLMENSRKEIKSMLSPSDIISLKQSPMVSFVSADKKLKAVMRSVIQDIDELTRTQEVRFTLPNKSNVAAGLSGRIEWQGISKLLPSEYILRRKNQLGVMLVENIVKNKSGKRGKAKFIPLLNAKEGQATIVSLPESTAIVTDNRYRVHNGDNVKIQ